MIQTEKWNIILSDFSGWQTDRDSDDLPIGKSPDVLNARFNGSNIRGSLGYELIGTRNTTAGEITAQYTYNRNDGQQRMLRVRDDGSTGKLEWWDATNEEWYVLLPGLTTGKRMGFAEFNTSTTNQMVCCNGVQNMSVWTGAATRLTSAVAGGATTINVASTADFPATGTIIYNGTEIAYTAKTDTTFTVGSAHASAGASDGVAQAIDDSTHSGVTKGNILLSAFDRLWIAGQPSEPSVLDYSDEGAAFTFTGGSNRTDSGSEDIYNIGGYISALSYKDDKVVVFGPDGAVGFGFIYPTSTTKAPSYNQYFSAPGQGPKSALAVCRVNNDVLFANLNGVESLTERTGSDKVVNKSISRAILPTLRQYDMSEAVLAYFNKEQMLLMACKTDADFSANDVVVAMEYYRTRAGRDTMAITKFDWPVNVFSMLNDELYFGSSVEMNSFKGFSTYQNDGAPRTIRVATKRVNLKDPFQNKSARLACVRGYIKDGTDINVDILFNAGFLGTLNKTIESTGAYVSQAALNAIGAFQLGINPIGASLDEVQELKEFTVFLDIGVDYRWRDIQFIMESDTDGGTFIITHIGLAADYDGYASEDQLTI